MGSSRAASTSLCKLAPAGTSAPVCRREVPAILQRANQIVRAEALKIGQRLVIPGGGTRVTAPPKRSDGIILPRPVPPSGGGTELVAPEGHGFYQVEPGDTLYSVARTFGTSPAELRRLNSEIEATSMAIGKFLLVPVRDESLYK